ncbi:M48 family metallopeptidase [Candidatus Gracilibacteria bacterium]|nr:M48 family metallopeptidase [Candidatus Gracilibacteria bacterium]MBF0913710.1 M48 family metallopeptidase [Candidatus Gracilibacteria bacterium]
MKIIREKRKTLSIRIGKGGELLVKVPKKVSQKIILDFLEKHKTWISEKQNLFEENSQKFEIGEKFLFFGEEFDLCELEAKNDKNVLIFDSKKFFTNTKNPEILRELFIKFYKKEAKKYISKKISEICELLNLSFNKLKITSASSRWGSCNSKKNISFSFRLILAPKKSIDYVIVHELAHLSEMNHSKAFWDLVQNYSDQIGIGSYKENKKWLMQNHLKTNF